MEKKMKNETETVVIVVCIDWRLSPQEREREREREKGVPQNQGYLCLGVPIKAYGIFGFVLGSPYVRKLSIWLKS